jgi:hypothetical protein
VSGGNPLDDNDTLTLNDGFGVTKTFEFDTAADGVAMGHVDIDIAMTDTATQVRNKLKSAINMSGIGITATDAGDSGIKLTNDRASSLGNVAIDPSTVTEFYILGMTGGTAGDCPMTTPCTNDDDCRPGLSCSGASGSKTCQ